MQISERVFQCMKGRRVLHLESAEVSCQVQSLLFDIITRIQCKITALDSTKFVYKRYSIIIDILDIPVKVCGIRRGDIISTDRSIMNKLS